MKKGISIILSLVAIVTSVATLMVSIRTMKMVSDLQGNSKQVVEIPSLDGEEQLQPSDEEVNTADEEQQQAIDAMIQAAKEEELAKAEQTQDESNETEQATENQENFSAVVQAPSAPVGLSDEEKQQRKQNQLDIAAARDFLYSQPHTVSNVEKINELDKMLIANNTFNFSGMNILFSGDSITQGVGSTPDSNGNLRSYVPYVTSDIQFNTVWNTGIGGWMYSDCAGNDFSIVYNRDTKVNIGADIMIFFAGANDYLAGVDNKCFGNIDDVVSTSGYCGQLRVFMKYLQLYFSDREIFFVQVYPLAAASGGTYSDQDVPHKLSDYMDVQKKLAAEYGFHTIDMYSDCVLDATVPELVNQYQSDTVHPNDEGYRVLGDHIAAELAYYFTQNR